VGEPISNFLYKVKKIGNKIKSRKAYNFADCGMPWRGFSMGKVGMKDKRICDPNSR
jgi:hypothetical protein